MSSPRPSLSPLLPPMLPLLLSLARAAPPAPAPAPAPAPHPRQLLMQVLQNAVPVRPLQSLQSGSLQGALTSGRPLQMLQGAAGVAPVRPVQALQSQLPARPLQSLQGLPGLSWLQNSQPLLFLQNAATAVAINEASALQQKAQYQPVRRRRRSVESDVAEALADEVGGMEAADLADQVAEEAVHQFTVTPKKERKQQSSRQEKALQYLSGGYLVGPSTTDYALDYDDGGLTLPEEDGNELLSRAAPYRNRNQPDSPIYYIRLPPAPYVLVPGVGYVSQSSRRPLSPLAAPPPPPPPSPAPSSPFYNLPLAFMSNGKPTGVYQPSWSPPQRPRPPPRPQRPQSSSIFSLNKGPYVFNGRPNDIYILRDSYDSLYGDTLSSFYP